MSRKRWQRPATREEFQFVDGNFTLCELFYDYKIQDFFEVARARIVNTFLVATEPRLVRERLTREITDTIARVKAESDIDLLDPEVRGFKHLYDDALTENYIVGLGTRRADLVNRIVQRIGQCSHFIRPGDLPDWCGELPYTLAIKIASQAEAKVIKLEVDTMIDQSAIWCHAEFGVWCVAQSEVDRYISTARTRRQKLKRDDRSFHGKVRSQVQARQLPPGASTSGQYAS